VSDSPARRPGERIPGSRRYRAEARGAALVTPEEESAVAWYFLLREIRDRSGTPDELVDEIDRKCPHFCLRCRDNPRAVEPPGWLKRRAERDHWVNV
jgi:hypothetical protein